MKHLFEPSANPIAYLDAISESLRGYRSVISSHLKCRHHFDNWIEPERDNGLTWGAYDAKVEEHFHAGTPWNIGAFVKPCCFEVLQCNKKN